MPKFSNTAGNFINLIINSPEIRSQIDRSHHGCPIEEIETGKFFTGEDSQSPSEFSKNLQTYMDKICENITENRTEDDWNVLNGCLNSYLENHGMVVTKPASKDFEKLSELRKWFCEQVPNFSGKMRKIAKTHQSKLFSNFLEIHTLILSDRNAYSAMISSSRR